MMHKLFGGLAGLILLASNWSPAQATTFNVTSETYNTANVVNLTYAGPPSKTESVYATPVTLHGQYDGMGSFFDIVAWCLDVVDTAYVPYTYNIAQYSANDVRPGMRSLDGGQLRQIASLMENGLTGSTLVKAATQLAIWKVEYGSDITFNGLTGTLLSTFQALLISTALNGTLDCPGCILTVLSDDPQVANQTFGFVSQAPIPGAVWLFAGGLAGLGAMARRRRQKLTAPAVA